MVNEAKSTATLEWEFDAQERVVHFDGQQIHLTKMESRAFAHLFKHLGEVVEREVLEREVWGIRKGVRSETVPVTIRTMRSKLKKAGLDVLVSVRGVGYKLLSPQGGARRGLPQFRTPLFERPQEVEAVQALWDAGWRVISIVGPGGSGKTRLLNAVAHQLPGRLTYVDLSCAQNEADVVLAVLTASGMAGGRLSGLAVALENKPSIFVVDEAELVVEAVNMLVESMPQHRFLLSSQVALGRSDEALHSVSPLVGEEGRRFVQARMAAARWGDAPSDQVLDKLLDAVDGLPLAIEVIVAHAESPLTLLHHLERGGLPDGQAGQALQEALARSHSQLTPEARDLLHCLCAAGTVLSTEHIVHWRGEEARPLLEVLARRSLLHREEKGWRVLTTMRTFVRQREGRGAERDFREWLFRFLSDAANRLEVTPGETGDEIFPLLEPARHAITDCPAERVSDVLWAFLICGLMRGPYTLYENVFRLVAPRHTEIPVVTLMSCVYGVVPETPDVLALIDSLTEQELYRLYVVRYFYWLPQQTGLARWNPRPSKSFLGSFVTIATASLETPADIAALRGQLASLPERTLQTWMMQFALARRLHRSGRELEAIADWNALIETLTPVGLPGALIYVKHALADAWVRLDPERGAEAFVDVAELARSSGFGDSWVVGRCGLWLCLLGRWTEALKPLQQGSKDTHRSSRLVCMTLSWILSQPQLESDALPNLEGIEGHLNDGTELRALVSAVATRSPLPGETTAATVWARTLKSLGQRGPTTENG